jgi:predicted enzyme related to lactoylglutathione lyase
MPILGIGGVFFRAKEPEALSAWYDRHLGVGSGHDGSGTKNADDWFWQVKAGPLVFAPFKAATDYWPSGKEFLLNFRVSGLDHLLSSLRASGIEVETRAEWDTPETGRFARICDPEGNPIELWEPPSVG